MWYLNNIYNNTRYIVFIQTIHHQDIKPANDVSMHSLKTLLESVSNYRWYFFRSIRININDVTRLKIYEMNFINYKENVLSKSDFWKNTFSYLFFIEWLLNIILYLFVYKKEVNKFWNEITNNKPKYLIDKSEEFVKLFYWRKREFEKDKNWKEIIEEIDFTNWSLYINEKKLILSKSEKSEYFLKLLSDYFSENEYEKSIMSYDLLDIYEEKNEHWYNYLKLSTDNIKKSYIKTINKAILLDYNKEILEMKGRTIGLTNQVREMY
jgi:hypothetical protein